MKKRIISLLLALAMVMSVALVLVSCKDDPPDEPSPPVTIPTETIKYLPSVKQTGTSTSSTTTNSFVIDDEAQLLTNYYFSALDGYVRNYRTSITDSASYEGAEHYSYALFSELSGQKYEFIVTQRGTYEGEYADKTVVDYYIDYDYNSSYSAAFWGGILLTLEYADGTFTHYLFDSFLNEIDKIENSDSRNVSFYVSSTSRYNDELNRNEDVGYIYLDGNEYYTKNFYYYDSAYDNKDYYVEKLSEDEDEGPSFNLSDIEYDKEKEEYTYLSDDKAARFDKDGKLIFSYTLPSRPLSAECNSAWLDNGNVFFSYTHTLHKNETEYDFYRVTPVETIKRNYKAFIYSPADGKLTEIKDFKYLGQLKTASSSEIKDLKLAEGTSFMIEPTIICEDGSIQRLEKTIVAFDDNLEAIKYYKYPAVTGNFETLQNGAIVYHDLYTSYIVDAEGNKIANLPLSDTEQINNKWFIDNGCVYNEKYELLYNFASQGRELYTVCDNVILLWDEVTIEDTPTTCLIAWMGVNSERVLCTKSELDLGYTRLVGDYVISQKTQENGYDSLELLKLDDGTSVKKWENVNNWYYDEPSGHGNAPLSLSLEVTTVEEIYEDELLVGTEYTTEIFVIYTRPNVILR